MGGEPPPGYSSRRHAHQAGRRRASPPRPAARWRSRSATSTARLRALEKGARCTWFLPRPKAARRASAGSPARWRRSARWWSMPARRARSPPDVRCCRPACARSRARSSAAIRSWCAARTATALARGLSAYASADARAHRRPSLRRDRGDPRLARARRDHPPRRPGAAVSDRSIADAGKRDQRQDATGNVERMHIETEATQHLQRAAQGRPRARRMSWRRTLGRRAQRRAARDGGRAARARRRTILAANAADLAADAPAAPPRSATACADRGARRGDGAGAGGHRRPARSARPHAGRLDAAERAAHPAHRHADRRHRHDLREPARMSAPMPPGSA